MFIPRSPFGAGYQVIPASGDQNNLFTPFVDVAMAKILLAVLGSTIIADILPPAMGGVRVVHVFPKSDDLLPKL
jgi:hypothetical protein